MKRLELIAGLTLVGLVVACAIISFVWTPYDPTHVAAGQRLLPPSPEHVFGTDGFGRDVLSRLLVGARSCLTVGVISVGIAAVVGLVGLIYRRRVNRSVFLATSRQDKVMYVLLAAAILRL